MQPPPLPQQVEILQRVLDRVAMAAADGGHPPLVVFGVDGALYDSRPRTLQILLEYAEDIRHEDPEIADALSSLSLDRVHYLLSNTLRECGITHADLVRDVTSFWRERFHTDDYAILDEPNPGAVDYVRALHSAGGGIIYLSGRDIHGMLLGTVTSLRDHGFPVAEVGVQVILKPDATLGTDTFKRSALPLIGRSGDVLAVFDDQVSSCEIAKARFPEASVGLVDTWMEGPLTPGEGIEHVRDFRQI
ncbi:MAG: hypothetical protein AAGE52_37430 [Myxococcota bacterium]